MTDKMREELDDIAVLTALRKAGATEKELAILTYESGPYEITKPTVFMQKLASVLAAQSVPAGHKQVADDLDEDIKQLMRFYSVTNLVSLVRIQSERVARLQKKLPPMRDEHPRNPRSGGE